MLATRPEIAVALWEEVDTKFTVTSVYTIRVAQRVDAGAGPSVKVSGEGSSGQYHKGIRCSATREIPNAIDTQSPWSVSFTATYTQRRSVRSGLKPKTQ